MRMIGMIATFCLPVLVAACGPDTQRPTINALQISEDVRKGAVGNFTEADMARLIQKSVVRLDIEFFGRWRDGGRKKNELCSGVLIEGGRVITALHCLYSSGRVGEGARATDITAYMGESTRFLDGDAFKVHNSNPKGDFGTLDEYPELDIAVLDLENDSDLAQYLAATVTGPVTQVTPGQDIFHAHYSEEDLKSGIFFDRLNRQATVQQGCKAGAGITSEVGVFPNRNFNFSHTCGGGKGSSGSPIFDTNLQVVGIHLGQIGVSGKYVASRLSEARQRSISRGRPTVFGQPPCRFGTPPTCQPDVNESLTYDTVSLCANALRVLDLDAERPGYSVRYSNYDGFDRKACVDFGASFAERPTSRCDYEVSLSEDAVVADEVSDIGEKIAQCYRDAGLRGVLSAPKRLEFIDDNQVCIPERKETENTSAPNLTRYCVDQALAETGAEEYFYKGLETERAPAAIFTIDQTRRLFFSLSRIPGTKDRGALSFIGLDIRDYQKPRRKDVLNVQFR